ncbi:MAG TPA: arginine--tRNA ligase [Chitinophagales bacterium]|nr:arginine--tRNA ligase [Chitinophagales bacterium]
MTLEQTLKQSTADIFKEEYGVDVPLDTVTINITKKEHEGDYTIVVFPLTKVSKKSPEQTAELLGAKLQEKSGIVGKFNVIKGFLNLSLTDAYWTNKLKEISGNAAYGTFPANHKKVVLEYCGPNTNKPLHIGHLRNVFLGFSMAEILKAAGYDVTKVNIYNDRGIAICKSMIAYTKFGNGATPQSTGIKGDHFVGDWYVTWNTKAKEELQTLTGLKGEFDEDQKMTSLFKETQEMLLKWEAGDPEVVALWEKMNSWVYEGFQQSFNLLGIDFQKDYYESKTYMLGKNIVEEGLQKNVFKKRADGAVIVDLTPDGLDEKVLLRPDGTSIYITQDLATAELRYKDFGMDKMIYVVANEQDYHFKVLKLALQKLGKKWADGIYHLSYALVESPTGRFKSREGKTADADDLAGEVLRIAEEKTKELGKIEGFTEEQAQQLYKTIGLGALKYFVLRVNPYKKIIFNPEESIDFHGQTGPFIQYTHARVCAIMRKAGDVAITGFENLATLAPVERELVIHISEYENTIRSAADKYDPSEVASYVYTLAKLYNKFYHELPILNAATDAEKNFRIGLSKQTGIMLKKAMKLLGIDVPEKM